MSNITEHERTLDERTPQRTSAASGGRGVRSIRQDGTRALDSARAGVAMPQHVYFDTVGAAKHLGVAPRSLETLRAVGGSPRFVRIGRVVRYREDWLDEWAEQKAVGSTSEETARRRA